MSWVLSLFRSDILDLCPIKMMDLFFALVKDIDRGSLSSLVALGEIIFVVRVIGRR